MYACDFAKTYFCPVIFIRYVILNFSFYIGMYDYYRVHEFYSSNLFSFLNAKYFFKFR